MSCWALGIDWPVITQGFGAVAQGAGALVLAWVGWAGLSSWRKQLKATKLQTLAEDALTLVYQLRDVIKDLRRPVVAPSESEMVTPREGESQSDLERRRIYGVIELRYLPHAEKTAQLEAIRYRVLAALGAEAAHALDGVLGILRRVRHEAVNAQIHFKRATQYKRRLDRSGSADDADAYAESANKGYAAESWAFSSLESDDPVDLEVDRAVTAAESALRSFAMMTGDRSSR